MKNLAKTVIAVMFCMMISSFSQAQAVELITTTLDFEEIINYGTEDFVNLPSSSRYYGGFNWDTNWGIINKTYDEDTGFEIGATSGSYSVFNRYGSISYIQKLEGTFNFISANLTSAFFDNNVVTVEAWSGSEHKYIKVITLNTSAPQTIQFDFNNITKIKFSPVIPEGQEKSQYYFAMDDFKYSSAPTPEPSSMILGFLSLSGLMGIRRRKNS